MPTDGYSQAPLYTKLTHKPFCTRSHMAICSYLIDAHKFSYYPRRFGLEVLQRKYTDLPHEVSSKSTLALVIVSVTKYHFKLSLMPTSGCISHGLVRIKLHLFDLKLIK